jgi:hypothetical protein
MVMFNPNSQQRIDKMDVSDVLFLGEQDGVPERELKARLIPVLNGTRTVARAYLAKIAYGPIGSANVALCLRTTTEPDSCLLQALSQVFSSMFSSNEHLDILVLDDEKEARLSGVCHAFFAQESNAQS